MASMSNGCNIYFAKKILKNLILFLRPLVNILPKPAEIKEKVKLLNFYGK
jgi:hypothetical protein